MSITKNPSGEIVYTAPKNAQRDAQTGTVVDDEFAIVDNTNVLKQIQFYINPLDSGPGVLTVEADIAGDQTVNFSALGSKSNSFATIQPDLGTSPAAATYNDILTLTSSNASLAITGNSSTDTIDFIVMGVANYDGGRPDSVYGGSILVDGGTP
jgi:hypothetical protein